MIEILQLMRQNQGKNLKSIKTEMMAKGKVKWYNEVKGFGFIETETGEDIFVHRTGLVNSYDGLQTDQLVEFDTQQGDKGLAAINVKLVN